MLQEPVQVMLTPAPRLGTMPGSQSEQRLRGLLRPRPGFSRLPFGDPCLSLVSPEALPAPSAEVSRVPSPPVRAEFGGNHWGFPSVLASGHPPPPTSRGPCPRWETRGSDGAPGAGTEALLIRAGGISH